MNIKTINELFHFVKVVGRSNTEYRRFCLKPEVSADASSCSCRSDLMEYADRFIQNLAPTQTVTERIFIKIQFSRLLKGKIS